MSLDVDLTEEIISHPERFFSTRYIAKMKAWAMLQLLPPPVQHAVSFAADDVLTKAIGSQPLWLR